MSISPLIRHLESFIPLAGQEKFILERRFVEMKVKKKEKILVSGEVCKYYYFIVEGCFRMFGVDDKGFEHNIQFAAESDWISDIGSFYPHKSSQMNIESLEPSEVLRIARQDLFDIFDQVPMVSRIFKVMIDLKYIELQNRVLQNFSSSAEQRYLAFLEQYPHLINRLPNTQVASYIGITPEFLSKIRKDIRDSQDHFLR